MNFKCAYADTAKLAVLYPETRGGYSKVFENILTGINEFKGVEVLTKHVSNKTDSNEIDNWLKDEQVQTIIALGQRSYRISKKLTSNLPLTIGALNMSPQGYGGISMDANPETLFNHLKDLAPKIKRVHVVYCEENTGWLIRIAEKAAQKEGIELVTYEVDDLIQGIKVYKKIITQVESHVDAIWITLDRVVPDKAILPMVLKTAWEKNIVVYSDDPIHTKKGTLFALYPDYKMLGKTLAEVAVEKIGSTQMNVLLPTSDLKSAFNKRTASHLGLSVSESKQRQFDVVFPVK